MKMTIGELQVVLAKCTLPRDTEIEVAGEFAVFIPGVGVKTKEAERCDVSRFEQIGGRAVLHVTD
jgi:hypothetical protein